MRNKQHGGSGMIGYLVSVVMLFGMFSAGAHAADNEYTANFVPYMVTDPELCPDPNLATGNKDVRGLHMLLSRQMIEMATSSSALVPEISVPDRTRISSYIAEIESYQAQINASDPADYPGTHRLFYCLYTAKTPPTVTSQAINDLLVQWTLTSGELLTSASALIPAGLRVPDDTRLTQHIAAMKNYLTYVDASAVQDYPRQGSVTKRIEDSAGIARSK